MGEGSTCIVADFIVLPVHTRVTITLGAAGGAEEDWLLHNTSS